jgi:protein gp37
MGDGTNISWTDATWNVTRGCRRVSAGCENCYAERHAIRMSGPGKPYHGLVKSTATGPRWTGEVAFDADALAHPLRWIAPRTIFVDSMADLFYERFSNEQIAAVFGVMAACPRHTFQVLTKRARRMREWFEWANDSESGRSLRRCGDAAERLNAPVYRQGQDGRSPWNDIKCQWPLPNVWLGVSVEDQEAADERIPELLRTPAAVRFLSCEPLIGQTSLAEWIMEPTGNFRTYKGTRQYELKVTKDHSLGWVIAGCESGPGARPCSVEWLRSLRDQCAAARVPFWLKQAVAADHTQCGPDSKRKGGGVVELPYLDGEQHRAMPEAAL